MWLTSTGLAVASFSFQLTNPGSNTISDHDQVIDLSLDITDLPSPSYFRVAFQKSAGSNYFGWIKNNQDNWVNIQSLSADCKNYYYYAATGSGTLNLSLKIGNSDISAGEYQIIGHRFTSTACSNTKSQNELPVNFVFPSNTPAPIFTSTPVPATQTPTQKPTPKPIPTRLEPTERRINSLAPTEIPPTPTITPQTPTITKVPIPNDPKTNNYLPHILISLGLSILGLALYKVY